MAKWTIPDMIHRSQADAMVAAKLREAAEVAAHEADYVPHKAEDFRKAILALILTPADAALTKLLAEARAEGMRKAAKEAYYACGCQDNILIAADAIQKEGGA